MALLPENGLPDAPLSSSASSIVQFAPLTTLISPDFWHLLSKLKLDRLRLDERPVPLAAAYSPAKRVRDRRTGQEVLVHSGLTLDQASLLQSSRTEQSVGQLSSPPTSAALAVRAEGNLLNFNTAIQFTSADKNALFNDLARDILQDLISSPEPLQAVSRFVLLTYADLKKYKFYHWAAIPALIAQPAWNLLAPGWIRLREAWNLDSFREPLSEHLEKYYGSPEAGFCLVKTDELISKVVLGRIIEFVDFFDGVPGDERVILFVDPSSNSSAPSWPLRNLLALLSVRFRVRSIRVICWRDDLNTAAAESMECASSFGILRQAESTPDTPGLKHLPSGDILALAPQAGQEDRGTPAAVGWERNAQGKLAPKVADLGPLMDPKRLADQAVDLNLKLMRWRIMPDIQLEKIASTRCLLLGAGTLGCYVARVLLGWGIRQVTLVDNGRVSYSNPVRQPLFDFEDCTAGGKPKAQCAAKKLVKIYPGVHATGLSLSIPMPGHSLLGASGSLDSVRRDVAHLEQLFDEHDAVFLLTDSRESRWLPTLLGAAKDRTVINAALGFDSYLVMRHGAGPGKLPHFQDHSQPSNSPPLYAQSPARLGCYFCNDVVAPTDSLTDRTLDQMCTVTRPGLAAIAGASAVELLVSLLHHRYGNRAPAPIPLSNADQGERGGSHVATILSNPESSSGSPLGLLPHQIRGFLSSYTCKLVTGAAFDRCTACSELVVAAYKQQGWEMLRRALGDDSNSEEPVDAATTTADTKRYGYLERLTGLDELYRQTERMLEEEGAVEEWSSEDGDEGVGVGVGGDEKNDDRL